MDDRERLIRRLDRARSQMRAALAGIAPGVAVTPEWTAKELVAHIAGWDAACRDTLRAHAAGAPQATPARGRFDAFNAESVAQRRGLSYEQTLEDWERTLDDVIQAARDLSAEKAEEAMTLPWGPKGTVERMLGAAARHIEQHARELRALRGG